MTTEWKLVPVEPNREMCLAARQASAEHPIKDQADSPVIVYRAMLGAAPVPPAGGEVEVLGMREVMIAYENANAVHLSGTSNFCAVMAGHLNKAVSAHVTRLQAENSELLSSVSTWRVHHDRVQAERDALKADLEAFGVANVALRGERNALQSELTKARELLGKAIRFMAPVSVRAELEDYTAHQSAPAAKGGAE